MEQKVVYPRKRDDFLHLLSPKTLLYAGGTGLFFRNLNKYEYIIDLSTLEKDKKIEDSGNIILGSGVTINELRFSNLKIKHIEKLQEICKNIASTPLRNLITVGGEIIFCPYWANLPVYFMAVKSLLIFYDKDKNKIEVPISKYYKNIKHYKNLYLSKIIIPSKYANYNIKYFNFKETHFDYSTINYVITYKDSNLNIVLGAFTRFPLELDIKQLKESPKEYLYSLEKFMRNDVRYSKKYRMEILYKNLYEDLREIGVL